jgi:Holliday junction resolvasome RuvABC endonuclease subunit
MPTRDLVIGLDLTTCTGWAALELDGRLDDSGAWDMSQPSDAHDGDLWVAFGGRLEKLLTRYSGRICALAFERPTIYGHWDASRIAFGQAALVELAAARRMIPTITVSAGTMRKVTTGKGRATKAEVQRAVIDRTGDLRTERGGSTKTERDRRDKLRGDEADARAVVIVVIERYQPDELRDGRLVKRRR